MKYIYGPVKSRRLGLSLGINLTPYKTCTFDCVYCQLGKTTNKTVERKEYIKIEDILEEVKDWINNNPQDAKNLTCVTLSGSGEPALNIKIGELVSSLRSLSSLPLVVITNSSLLNYPAVRQELILSDLIIPSLDAATIEVLTRIDRPDPGIKIEDITEGLIALSKEFRGKIWLEIMLIKGFNDDLRHIRKLKSITDIVRPEKIQLNSPVRSTSEPDILPVEKNKLEKIKEILGDNCEII